MRGGIKRSRNGCINCKEKRLKCDEEKPSCRRCLKKGIPCGSKTTKPERRESDFTLCGSTVAFQSPPINPALSTLEVPLNSIEDEEISATFAPFADPGVYELPCLDSLPDILPSYSEQNYIRISDWSQSQERIESEANVQNVVNTRGKTGHHLVHFPMSQMLTDQSSVLVEYYFKEVAGLFSCYDGSMNPFRSNVSQLWGSSASIYYTVQSMSAACLVDVVPDLGSKGIKLREKATAAIELELSVPQPHTGSLLALIMLGLTSSWHDSNDLGRAEFDRAQTAFSSMQDERHTRQQESKDRNFQFFQKALLYWEMLMSYVADDQSSIIHQLQAGPIPLAVEDRIGAKLPHPWTGVACDAQNLVFEVGKLIRQRKGRRRRRSFNVEHNDEQRDAQDLYIAEDLKAKLEELSFPDINTIIDPGDMETPVFHFLKIAECYRDTGLLQLYHVFPELLSHPSGLEDINEDGISQLKQSTSDAMMVAMAMRVVDLLKSIPIESGTRCVQPFLLVAIASELQMPDSATPRSLESTCNALTGYEGFGSVFTTAIDILEARKFVLSRLSFLEHVLPAKPIRQMLNVMRETWRRMDGGDSKVYWMDIMMEKGWETIMG